MKIIELPFRITIYTVDTLDIIIAMVLLIVDAIALLALACMCRRLLYEKTYNIIRGESLGSIAGMFCALAFFLVKYRMKGLDTLSSISTVSWNIGVVIFPVFFAKIFFLDEIRPKIIRDGGFLDNFQFDVALAYILLGAMCVPLVFQYYADSYPRLVSLLPIILFCMMTLHIISLWIVFPSMSDYSRMILRRIEIFLRGNGLLTLSYLYRNHKSIGITILPENIEIIFVKPRKYLANYKGEITTTTTMIFDPEVMIERITRVIGLKTMGSNLSEQLSRALLEITSDACVDSTYDFTVLFTVLLERLSDSIKIQINA